MWQSVVDKVWVSGAPAAPADPIGPPIAEAGYNGMWVVHNGVMKSNKEPVSIFTFNKK